MPMLEREARGLEANAGRRSDDGNFQSAFRPFVVSGLTNDSPTLLTSWHQVATVDFSSFNLNGEDKSQFHVRQQSLSQPAERTGAGLD